MTYTEITELFTDNGLSLVAAQQWAAALTQDGREPEEITVHEFLREKLPQLRARRPTQKRRRPAEILTTPEEKVHN
jgi:hypothetical protein